MFSFCSLHRRDGMSHSKLVLFFLTAVMANNLELGAKVSFSLLECVSSGYLISTTERKLGYKVIHKPV